MSARRTLFVVGVVFTAVICFVPGSNAQTLPTPPQASVDTSYPVSTGLTINVAAGGDFQGALDRARLGDTILLQAGATFTGTFILGAKSGSGWIIVRTSAPDSSLPPAGTRITPAYAGVMPKIVAPSTTAALQTAAGAHHYRFTGIEFTVASGLSFTNYGLVALGDGSSLQNSASQVPYALVFDRVYVHGLPGQSVRRGIALNSGSTGIVDSYISEIHEVGADSQAIAGWNGPGPFKIVNNYLEGAGENVMFGGADASITNLVPSDIEVRGNYVFKPVAWRGGSWSVKNLFELKNARRVLIDGNIFEHNWPASQNGFSILITPRNQDGTAPWSVVEDVAFTHNIVRHVANAVNILGTDNLHPSQQTKRVLISNNLFDDVNANNWGGSGRLYQLLSGTTNVTIDHNTAFQTGEVIIASGASNSNFVFRNNIAPNNTYGVAGDGTFGNPALTLTQYFPGVVFLENVLPGGNASSYPANNFFPASLAAILFVDLAGSNYKLQAISPYKNAGTDAKDIGADIDAINAATAGAVSGGSSGPPPPPPPVDTTPPSVSITLPISGATLSGTVTVSANASDNVGVVGVQFLLDGLALGAEDTSATYQTSWNTMSATNGPHTLTAVARDAAGNRTTSSPVTVTVSNTTPDTTPPSVSVSAPANGATVSGTTTISANAADNVGVVGVQFFVDGSAYGAEDTASPYQVSWNTTTAANGSHTLTALARDAAGNRTTSAPVSANVANTAPPPPTRSPFTGTPFVVPGRFEAEDFDKGGEGVAYHDLTPGNQGGLYRTTEDVDIISPYPGGYVVNNFETGEWLEYTINVTQSGTYRVEALVSSEFTTSRFHIEVDRTDKTGAMNVPSTGYWGTFQWVGKDGISLTAGQHILRMVADVQYFNFDAIRISELESPFNGTASVVPGRFEAEDFDKGGEGVGYHDLTPGNQGGLYRTTEDVDIISPYPGGYVVNNFQTGEWLQYTINVTQSGTYRVEALVSSEFTTSRFHMEVDGTDITGAINVPSTGFWGTFQWIGKDGISLSAGQHMLRMVADVQYFNLDAIRITAAAAPPDTTPPAVAIAAPSDGATVSATMTILANASDNVGVSGVQFYVDGAALGAEVTAAPYQVSWNTTTATNGSHALTAVARDAAGNRTTSAPVSANVANVLAVTPPPPAPAAPTGRSPFKGSPVQVPGRIEAEDFDRGGEGVGYHDLTPGNQGGAYRTTEDVDIIGFYPLGYVVNNFQTGEWLEYTINVAQSGTYRIEAIVSSQTATSRFHIEVDRTDKTGVISVPNTGSWGTFQTVGKSGISLTAGQHIMRVYADAQYFNIDAILLSLEGASGRRRAGRH